jgi:chromosome partitioning protein
MPAKIITVTGRKGGSGKTTLTMQLAGTLGKRGLKVLVVDADPQGTAIRWAATAPDDTPFPAAVMGLSAAGGKVHREVAKFTTDYQFILVDCPPAMESPAPQSALLIADLALIPVIPSPLDVWSALGIRQLIETIRDVNDDLQTRLVINALDPRTSLAKEVVDILPDFDMVRMNTLLHHRIAYRQSAVLGSTVHVLGRRAAAAIKEVEELADELLSLLGDEEAYGTKRAERSTPRHITRRKNHGQ